ncbi:Acid protease [Mycena sanguinolenta]|uniref:Acid protease n=1 Tax=Mycena sanguinolenta TaxID=230812 RepID=A0A8H7DK15_9AGAR|nr:Acid protease [Mycena sanguinolenta]
MAIPPIFTMLFILLVFVGDSDVYGVNVSPSTKKSQIPPFISIPLIKARGSRGSDQLETLNSVAVHQMHATHGRRRLAAFISRSRSSATTEHHRSISRSPTRNRRHHARIARANQNRQNPQAEVMDSDKAIQSINVNPQPDTDLGRPSDAEVTRASDTSHPDSGLLYIEGRDIGYMAPLSVGTPFKEVYMLVDSGSADMWVGGEQCKGDNGTDCGDHRFLGPESSSSFVDTGVPWYMEYGSGGSAAGNLINDTVRFASITLQNHTFGVTQYESPEFTADDIPFDGVLGCAKDNLSMQQTPTLLSALQKAGLITERICSYKLSRESDGKHDGEFTIGGMDPSKYHPSSLIRIPSSYDTGFWEGEMDAVTVNGRNIDLGGGRRRCIFDTGTTLIIAPQKSECFSNDVDAIHNSIPGARFDNSSKAWTFPCNMTNSVALVFGGRPFPIHPVDLAFQPADNSTSACTSAIVKGDVSGDSTNWLLGATFLKNVYLSTNQDRNEISLARLAN